MSISTEHPAERACRIRAEAHADAERRRHERFTAMLRDPAASARWSTNQAWRRVETLTRLSKRGVGVRAELDQARRDYADALAREQEWM